MTRKKHSKAKRKPTRKAPRARPLPERVQAGASAISPSDLRNLLRNLPVLACAPEMEGFGFDADEMREAEDEGLEPPDAIGKLAAQAFHARLLVRLNEIKYRAWKNKDDPLFFQADSARYYVEEARGPAWDNPLVVACYYKSLAAREGKDFTASTSLAAVKAYERKYKTLLAKKTKAHALLNSPSASTG